LKAEVKRRGELIIKLIKYIFGFLQAFINLKITIKNKEVIDLALVAIINCSEI